MKILDHDAQAAAVAGLRQQVWKQVVEQFRRRQAEGLRQVDLATRLGVSRPQIHIWLSDPKHISLRAAARLMLAMGAELQVRARGRTSAG